MAFLPDGDEPRKVKTSHTLGEDLSALSVEELSERVALLKEEILRLEQAIAGKGAAMSLAENIFKKL
ncbi:MAG: DUF1192 domain-containing protein [Methylobacteriaceae bacterium]|jgi:uncharacterized small protein (DUF1192 family)|nr:DUF1192 domain-containing protein [Methylobacteriaceae bacterium]